MISKYKLLWKYLKENNQPSYNLNFEKISTILEFKLDHTFLTYKKEAPEMPEQFAKILTSYRQLVPAQLFKKIDTFFDNIFLRSFSPPKVFYHLFIL